MAYMRYRRPRKSGSMIKVDVVVMAHEGGGEYVEHVFTGYAPYKGCVWAAVKPSWSKFWMVVHADTGYAMRRAIKTADQAKVVVERMDKYWRNCSWETVLEHMAQVQRDLYYKRDEYRYRSRATPNLYWNTGLESWVEPDQATVWSAEQKAMVDSILLLIPGEWEIV